MKSFFPFIFCLLVCCDAATAQLDASGTFNDNSQDSKKLLALSNLFTEDFESGTLGSHWTVTGTEQYQTQVTTNYGPHGGTCHVTLGDTADGTRFSRNELTLSLNLADCEDVVLSFWARSYLDEPHGPPAIPFTGGADFDGVAISEDGMLWYEIQGLRSEISETYSLFSVDLDAAIATYGLSYNSTFRIRFNQYDNWIFPDDGIALDDISITGTIADTPEIHVSPMAGFDVTNRQGQVTSRTISVSNAPTAHGNLDITVSMRETGRSQSVANTVEPPAGRDFSKVAPDADYQPGRLLVRFSPNLRSTEQAASAATQGGSISRSYTIVPGLCLVELGAGSSVEQALHAFNAAADVIYAEPDYKLQADRIPGDSRFDELWGMHNTGQTGGSIDADIDATEAWEGVTESAEIIVAVIDTGIDYTHPDLDDNMWINTAEIPGNGLDDDSNGYVDDVHGYDFVNGDGDPMDDRNHGTHCAGTVGAEGNNAIGVAGVCWKVRLMAPKFLDENGTGLTSDAIYCVQYAMQMGAKVLSNSWGSWGYNQALKDAIDAAGALGIPFVVSAGNYGSDNDQSPYYPSSYESDNIISVISSDHTDAKSSFSSYGLVSTDLAAPGGSILSCAPGGEYLYLSGTSMAAPHVAGACALMLTINPWLTAVELKQILMDTVDPTLPGACASGGRINLAGAIAESDVSWLDIDPDLVSGIAPGDSANLTVYFDATEETSGTYTGELIVECNDPLTPAVSVPVRMAVEPDFLSVSPTGAVASSGMAGGPFAPKSIEYTLTNQGVSPLNWTAAESAAWLICSPASGTLPVSATTFVTASISGWADGLPADNYEEHLVFSNTASGVAQRREVGLHISQQAFYTFPMDTDPGWTTEGQWAFGQPTGEGSHGLDPISGHTGSKVYGYNLSGDYTNNMPQYWLTTPPLDCSTHSNVVLRFHRWLGVENAAWDHAEIEAGSDGSTWTGIWSHTEETISDTSWQEMNYDLSAVADGEPTVYIRWGMGPTDSAITYPGWNIDDVRLEGDSFAHNIHYVDGSNSTPAFPYADWTTAATNIQAAVEVATSNDVVLVADGIYNISSEIRVTNNIELSSVNGPEVTIIDGGDDTHCLDLGDSACLFSGFTIQNGGNSSYGGISCENTVPVVSNCVLNSNWGGSCGGMRLGTAYNCTFIGNSANGIGGMSGGTAFNCTFIGNGADGPGGMSGGTAYGCTFIDNHSYNYGGGMGYGTAVSCTFSANVASVRGGGMHQGTAENCTFSANVSGWTGGGMSGGNAFNCTFSDNDSYEGGGMYGGTATHCIFYDNQASGLGNDTYLVSARFSCASDLLHGSDGNVTNAPLFMDRLNKNYRLTGGSPCVNAGIIDYVSTALDLDGLPRIVDFVVDMGAYEYQQILNADGDQMSDGYEIYYFGGKTNAVATADEDNDGQNNGDEYIAGMNPLDPDSLFIITNCAFVEEGFQIEWPSVAGRQYQALFSTNLIQGFELLEADINWPRNSCTDPVNTNDTGCYRVDVQLGGEGVNP
jgi:subtilisin family serine protease